MRPSLTVFAVLLPLAGQAQSPWSSLVSATGAYARSDSVVGWSVAQVRGGRIVAHHEAGPLYAPLLAAGRALLQAAR